MNTEKFTHKASFYAHSRPNYPFALKDYLSSHGISRLCHVAEIGAGTGIFSRFLLEMGACVWAVEPNEKMRLQAQKDISSVWPYRLFEGSAERTNLPDRSVHAVVAAQSFHWFDPFLFKKECQRIQKIKNMPVFLIWNDPIVLDNPLNQAREKLFSAFCRSYQSTENYLEKRKKLIDSFFDPIEKKVFKNVEQITTDTYKIRLLSMTIAPNITDPCYPEFEKELNILIQTFSVKNQIEDKYETIVYRGILP